MLAEAGDYGVKQMGGYGSLFWTVANSTSGRGEDHGWVIIFPIESRSFMPYGSSGCINR